MFILHRAEWRLKVSIRYQSKNGKFENGGIKETGMSDYFTHTAFFVEKAATPEYMSEMCGKSAIETQSCICCAASFCHIWVHFPWLAPRFLWGLSSLRHQKMFLLRCYLVLLHRFHKKKIIKSEISWGIREFNYVKSPLYFQPMPLLKV